LAKEERELVADSKQSNRRRPACLDLFCGIGGLTLGLHRAGLRSLGGVDCWPDALATFERNLGLPTMEADLSEASVEELAAGLGFTQPDVDIVVGGPPCQGFSTVGKRDHRDPRNKLWTHLYELVNALRPAYVIIENVEGLIVSDRGRIRRSIEASFHEIGYGMKSELLRAADFGVPQLRKRVLFLGWLEGLTEPQFPEPSGNPYVTVEDAIFDLPELGPGETKTKYGGRARTPYQRARRNGSRTLHNHTAANHPPSLVRALEHIPDGGNRKSIPDELQPKSGFHNSYARLASWKPAIAVTSNMRKPSSARATHPTQHRGLTVREGLRLQSFDDDFVVLGSRTSQYLQVGNAVPPILAEAIGVQVLRAYRANAPRHIDEIRGCAAVPA
jgi:DNA (cytosine-5)-methyltransferase 1